MPTPCFQLHARSTLIKAGGGLIVQFQATPLVMAFGRMLVWARFGDLEACGGDNGGRGAAAVTRGEWIVAHPQAAVQSALLKRCGGRCRWWGC